MMLGRNGEDQRLISFTLALGDRVCRAALAGSQIHLRKNREIQCTKSNAFAAVRRVRWDPARTRRTRGRSNCASHNRRHLREGPLLVADSVFPKNGGLGL